MKGGEGRGVERRWRGKGEMRGVEWRGAERRWKRTGLINDSELNSPHSRPS